MRRARKGIIPLRKCIHCGQGLEDKNFYKLHNNSNIYAGNNSYLPVCKDCMKILYEQYRIKFINQFSALGMKPEELKENEIEKLAVRRLCMTFDIYYSDRLFDTALKQIKKFPPLDMIAAYMRISNLKQSKNKNYDDTILEENMSQELLKSAKMDKVRERFDDADNGLYQDIYNLCLKLIQSLKEKMNVGIENVDCETNDCIVNE